MTKGGRLRSIDQKMLTRSPFAFKFYSGGRVDDDRELLIPNPSGGQAEYDMRRRRRTGRFPEGEIAADIVSGLHPLREKLADVG